MTSCYLVRTKLGPIDGPRGICPWFTRGEEQGVRAPKHLGRGRKKGGPAGLRRQLCRLQRVYMVCGTCVNSFPSASPHFRVPLPPLSPNSTPLPQSILPFHLDIHRSNLQVIRPYGDTKEERRGKEVVRLRSLRPGHVPGSGHIRMRHNRLEASEATYTDVKGYNTIHHKSPPPHNTTTTTRGQVRDGTGRGRKRITKGVGPQKVSFPS
jgi:hypothetical protein